MKILSEQKSRVLAEKNGWSVDFAEGYLKGEYSRRSSAKLSAYAMVGLDDYCLGLRAGYFDRQHTHQARVQPHLTQDPVAQTARAGATASSTSAFKQGFAY